VPRKSKYRRELEKLKNKKERERKKENKTAIYPL
jgi:hypothetical protein